MYPTHDQLIYTENKIKSSLLIQLFLFIHNKLVLSLFMYIQILDGLVFRLIDTEQQDYELETSMFSSV